MTEKMKMHSMNKVDENIRKIGELFPNCLTERLGADGKPEACIDFDMLKQELSSVVVDGPEERYQFTWPDKKKSILLANAPISATLRPCREESVDFDNTENLYIEGDNLDVLKLLLETYLGKIKMIYIDPPYNTGSDFVYEDDFAESTEDYLANSGQYDAEGNRLVQNTENNGRFHTDWLNMIYPRLKVAKDLLSDDGVIAISIDDNEIDNLRKICDEVFGAENLINSIAINMNSLSGVKMTHAINGKRYPAQKEYLLLYKKGVKEVRLFIDKLHKEKWDKEYNLIIPEMHRGQFEAFQEMKEHDVNVALSEMHLLSLADYVSNYKIDDTEDWKWENAYRLFGSKSNRPLAKKLALQSFSQQIVAYRNEDGNMRFFRSDYNHEARDPRIELVQAEANSSVFLSDNWTDISNDGGIAQEGGVVFPNGKKPLALIERIIRAGSGANDFVLDFFSGSATTAHAVMHLNNIDSGKRKFIMVQVPELLDPKKSEEYRLGCRTVCDVGKKRIRFSGQKIKTENPLTAANLDIGFRVLKLDSSNMKDVYYNPTDYTPTMFESLADNIKEDRSPEDLLFQVMLDLGVLLSSKIEETTIGGKKVFNVADKFLIACFDTDLTDEVITEIAKQKPYYFVTRDHSMASDSVAANFDQIFVSYSPDTVRKVL